MSNEYNDKKLTHGMPRTPQNKEIFVVNCSVSLYGNLSCFCNVNPIHFHEPVKLVEGKMLLDLLALVGQY